MNDQDRRLWVFNDEGLYLMQKRSRRSITAFIKENRALIDEVAGEVKTGKKPAHYLAYGIHRFFNNRRLRSRDSFTADDF